MDSCGSTLAAVGMENTQPHAGCGGMALSTYDCDDGFVIIFNLFILKVDAWRVVKTKENEKKTQNKDTFKYFYCI